MSYIKQLLRQKFPYLWPKLSFIYWYIKVNISIFHPKLFIDLARVFAKGIPIKKNKKKLLFFHQANGIDNLSFQILISKSLQLRECQVKYLIGDLYFPHSCNLGIYPKLDYFRFLQYKLIIKKIINLSRIETNFTSEYFSMSKRNKIISQINKLDQKDVKNFIYKENNIFQMALPSVLHFLRAENINFNSSLDIKVLYETMSNICIMYDSSIKYLENNKPDVIFLINGLHWPASSMIAAAKKKNIKYITSEESFRRPYMNKFYPSFQLDVNRDSHQKYSTIENFREYLNKPDREIDYQLLDKFLKVREESKTETITYANKSNQDNQLLLKLKNFSKIRKTFVLFTGIGWDSAYRYNASSAFESSEEWLRETATFFVNKDVNLIIRIHPAESYSNFSMKKKTISIVEDLRQKENIFVINSSDKVSAYSLMELVKGGLTWASTTGLEMAIKGLPVITAFDRIYTQLGCSIDPRTKIDYFKHLDEMINSKINIDIEKTKYIARKIAYYYFIELNYPVRFINRGFDYDLPSLNLQSIKELEEGSDESLDSICNLVTS